MKLRELLVIVVTVQYVIGLTGDKCVLKNKAPGVCKPITQCQKAAEDRAKGILITECGNEGKNLIVCCESSSRPLGDISKEKCKEYAKAVFQEVWTWGGKVKEDVCAFKAGELIVGGEEAREAEFPHQAILGYGSDGNVAWKCGGSLISENFVLTAAHCENTIEDGPVRIVRLGELDYATTKDAAEPIDYKVVEFIKHPEYLPPQRYNDIALLRLEKEVQFGKYIRPACLHTEFNIPPTRSGTNITRFITSGFGSQEFHGETSSKLMKVVIDYFTADECRKTYRTSRRKLRNGIVESSQLCAGGKFEMKDSCQGDSGGPLVTYYYEPELYCMYRLVGVTSFGKYCGSPGAAGVYSRVSHYIEWLENIVWP